MKRILVASLAALSLVLLSHQQASAYSKFKFGIGFNISWEGANNSFLCGLLKGGPGPGCCASDPYAGCVDGGGSPYCCGGGSPYSHGIGPDGFGAQPIAPPPPPAVPGGAPAVAQPVGYFNYPQQAGYGYYQQPSYGTYQQPDYSSYQVPSYWYGK